MAHDMYMHIVLLVCTHVAACHTLYKHMHAQRWPGSHGSCNKLQGRVVMLSLLHSARNTSAIVLFGSVKHRLQV